MLMALLYSGMADLHAGQLNLCGVQGSIGFNLTTRVISVSQGINYTMLMTLSRSASQCSGTSL